MQINQQTVVTEPQPEKKISPRHVGTPFTHPTWGLKGVRVTSGFTQLTILRQIGMSSLIYKELSLAQAKACWAVEATGRQVFLSELELEQLQRVQLFPCGQYSPSVVPPVEFTWKDKYIIISIGIIIVSAGDFFLASVHSIFSEVEFSVFVGNPESTAFTWWYFPFGIPMLSRPMQKLLLTTFRSDFVPQGPLKPEFFR